MMPTLSPTVTISWIKRLTVIIERNDMVIGLDDVPDQIWHAARDARTEAIVLRDELLELVVSPVES